MGGAKKPTNYRRGRSVVSALHAHLVFVTKYRRGVLSARAAQAFPKVQARLWGGHLWSPSYFVASCGGAPLEIVRRYIEAQRT